MGRLGEARDYTQLPHSSYDYTVTSSHEGLPTCCLTFSLATDNLQRTTHLLIRLLLAAPAQATLPSLRAAS